MLRDKEINTTIQMINYCLINITWHEQPAETLTSDVSGHLLISFLSRFTSSRTQEKIQLWENNVWTACVNWEKNPTGLSRTAGLSEVTVLIPETRLTFNTDLGRTILETLVYLTVSFSKNKRALTINHMNTSQCPMDKKKLHLFFSQRKTVFSLLICLGLSKLDL